MSQKPDGGQAYPTRDFWDEAESRKHEHGMNLRDWFAGQALAGMISRSGDVAPGDWLNNSTSEGTIASRAYQLADAMIAERAK